MKVDNVGIEKISSLLEEFNEFIIYYFDRLNAGKGKAGIDLDSVNEAFFFDGSRCLHIYREDEIKGLLYEEDGSEEILEEEQIVKFRGIKKIIVKKFIEYDEDNQAYISMILPSKLVFQEVE